jgi:hypothetical protein
MYALSHIQELQTLDISRPKSKPQTANPCCSGYRTAGTVEVLVPVRNVLMHHFNLPLAYLHQPSLREPPLQTVLPLAAAATANILIVHANE